MRAAGVPARIVAGYLGGENNPFGGYWIVRQSDAHAWVEVWLKDRGWIRVDPTTVVAPERAEGGADAALPEEERIGQRSLRQVPLIGEAVHRFVLGWDAVNTFWNRQVLGYSADKQRRFLSRLGISGKSWKSAAAVFAGAFVGAAALILLLFVSRPASRTGPPPPDKVQRAYLKLCKKLEKSGIGRRPDQGPADFLAEVKKRLPEAAAQLEPLFEDYIQLRYSGRTGSQRKNRFLRQVRRFSLKRPKKNPEPAGRPPAT
jgi:hypothetical protein